jgi:signal transduction histidine kinase
MIITRRVFPKTITAQITTLVIVAVLLGVCLTSAILLYLMYDSRAGARRELMAAAGAARIAMIVNQAKASQSPSYRARLIAMARWPGMRVEEVPLALLHPSQSSVSPRHGLIEATARLLESTWGISPLRNVASPGWVDPIVVAIDENSALVFDTGHYPPLHAILALQAVFGLAIVVLIVLLLSIYAVRWVTSPLSTIASAARSFGRSPEEEQPLTENGPHEIVQVAIALNDMRKRVRSLLDERTRMLVAISHDLRTPLTRLRLRTERLAKGTARHGMLHDISTINDMVGEILSYLREGSRDEAAQLVDLPSLLQTISTEFSDIGHTVVYEGPERFAFFCRAQGLTRVVTNIVDNGVKHGTAVIITLRASDDTNPRIDISDDGPGIPSTLRGRVFEPFFKGDSARSSSASCGFGLGLSIARDIIERHGGKIELLEQSNHGLAVRISLS